jgi:hypothetical protein
MVRMTMAIIPMNAWGAVDFGDRHGRFIYHRADQPAGNDHPFANRSLELRLSAAGSTLRPRPVRKPAGEGNDIGRLPKT